MACTLLVRGGEIQLHESEKFTKVKQRVTAAKKQRLDYKSGASDKFADGKKTELLFFTDLGDGDAGRILVDIDDCIGVMSDEYKDNAGTGPLPDNSSDDEEYEEDDEDEE